MPRLALEKAGLCWFLTERFPSHSAFTTDDESRVLSPRVTTVLTDHEPPDTIDELATFLEWADLEGAIAEYRAALHHDPNHVATHYNLGIALQDKGDLEEAIAEYRATVHLNPNHMRAHEALGTALHTQGDLKEAITEYRTAMSLSLDDGFAHYNLGSALHAKGDLVSARQEYKRAIILIPKTSENQAKIKSLKSIISRLAGPMR